MEFDAEPLDEISKFEDDNLESLVSVDVFDNRRMVPPPLQMPVGVFPFGMRPLVPMLPLVAGVIVVPPFSSTVCACSPVCDVPFDW